MDKKFMQQLIAELIAAQEEAISVLTASLARQLDATRLTEQMRAQIKAAEMTGELSPLGKQLAMHAMAAAEAESIHQNPAKH